MIDRDAVVSCDGCGVDLHWVSSPDRYLDCPIEVWKLVDNSGRSQTTEMPDGRHPWDGVTDLENLAEKHRIASGHKQPKKVQNLISDEDRERHEGLWTWYLACYQELRLALELGCNPYRHSHGATFPPASECPWHCGEPMWYRPTGWHCRVGCQHEPFDVSELEFTPNERTSA